MNIFLSVLLVSFAVSYLVEILALALPDNWSPRLFKTAVALPLAFYGCWILSITGFALAVAGLAASFLVSFLGLLVSALANRPYVIDRRR